MNCEETERGCVCEVVKLIHHIQKNRKHKEKIIDSCDKPYLGEECDEVCPNTRPFVLYTSEGNLWKAFFEDKGCVGMSPVFRVEKMDGCCATLRVLVPRIPVANDEELFSPRCKWVATESFITIDLNCACAIQCLDDTFIDCL